MLSAAMRPCLLAGPPRGVPFCGPRTHKALDLLIRRPPRRRSGSEVSMWLSVTMPPFLFSVRPAEAARALLGVTPMENE